MTLDDALKEAFAREIGVSPGRYPSREEVSSACSRLATKPGETRGLRIADLAPILAMAAVALFAIVLDPVHVMSARPLARELVVSVPADVGSRFVEFVLEAGESYRSAY